MRPVTVAVGPLVAAVVNGLALSQLPVSGAALALNGSLAANNAVTLDTPRRLILTYGNEVSARTLVLTGTNWSGNIATETLAIPSGGAGTVVSVLDYLTLTSAVPAGGGWSAAVTLGTNAQAASPWVNFDSYSFSGLVALMCEVTGTANYTVQITMDDPNSPSNPVPASDVTWLPSLDLNVVGATTSQMSYFSWAPAWARIMLNSGSGSVDGTFTQYGSMQPL